MMKRGFTLIELLIVVAIIGILAAIAVPNFLQAQIKAKLAQAESNMKALSTSMMIYQADWNSLPLHDPNHNENILGNGLTTPVAYISSVPIDVFQSYDLSQTRRMFGTEATGRPELHPEPFYAPAFGHPALDGNPRSLTDLSIRFKDNPHLWQKAQSSYATGRYLVSVGPDTVHDYQNGTYDITNGLVSGGDMIRVIP